MKGKLYCYVVWDHPLRTLACSRGVKNLQILLTDSIKKLPTVGGLGQRYTYRVLYTIQMKLILLCGWAEPAVLGSTKTPLKFKYEIEIG